MILPKTYTQKTWEKGGSNPLHDKYIGKPQLSWSQIEKWRNTKKESFNNVDGKVDYIMDYFLHLDTTSSALSIYGDFGTEVENYICERKDVDKFSAEDLKILDTIQPLGNYQVEIVIDFGDFVVLGYIDDLTPIKRKKIDLIRDYKTKSEKSKADLHSAKKLQLPLYIGALEQKGIKVGGAEYCIIERKELKPIFKGGSRQDLVLGGRVWYEPFIYDQNTIDLAFSIVRETAVEISKHYEIYLKLNG